MPRRGLLCRVALVLSGLLQPLSSASSQAAAYLRAAPYLDTTRSVDARVQDLLARMGPLEKFHQLYMTPGNLDNPAHDYTAGSFGLQVSVRPGVPAQQAARAHAAHLDSMQQWFRHRTRLGIPALFFDEALHGLMREGATAFPQAIGLAATFDTALVARVHEAAARETRSRGIRMVLSPVVNIATDVRWGRTEETFGEDPWLVSAMGRAHVRAFEQAGIVATPKHFVANVGAGGRDSYPVDVSLRELTERHFPPFLSAIRDAGARSVMTAYNSVDGDPATQSRFLLTTVLRDQWKFPGFVISDAAATGGAVVLHRTERNTPEAAVHAWTSGLDVVFQSTYEQMRPYWRAVEQGMVSTSILDSAVARVLRVKFALGLFDDTRIVPDSAAYWNGHATHRALAREAAAASIVLLHNTPRRVGGREQKRARAAGPSTPVLPLAAGLRRVALIGPDADSVRLGGYSGPGLAPVSLRAALAARRGIALRYARGPGRDVRGLTVVPASALSHGGAPGLSAQYWDNPDLAGSPTLSRVDETLDFTWTLSSPGAGLPYDHYSARWTGVLTVPKGGTRALAIEGADGVRIWVDDVLLLDRWTKRSAGVWRAPVSLAAGAHALRVEFHERRGNVKLKLLWDVGTPQPVEREIAEAVAAARASGVAVVVAGIEEGEFRDRSVLALPGAQERLIAAVAATGVPTVVVIVGGSAVTMPWLDRVDAVLMAWYPGEEGGNALADVLFGDVNPSGRLPISFPQREGQLPLTYDHKPTGRGDDYLDGSGAPLFPFGHGLSYTTFSMDSLSILSASSFGAPANAPPPIQIRVRVTNTGARAGNEVVQLYVRAQRAPIAQPVISLRSVSRVFLQPGESRWVEFRMYERDFTFLNRDLQWAESFDSSQLMIGASSVDIRLWRSR